MRGIYTPQKFDVVNEEHARHIILTPEDGTSTQERWEKETSFLVKDICSFIKPTKNTLILDFGCGIGRMAKALIAESDCKVIGLDISQSMRNLSMTYVNSGNFSCVSTKTLKNMIDNGFRVDACISLWVLQHCPNLEGELGLIKSVLKDDASFYLLNKLQSVIPTDKGWINDGKDIKSELNHDFSLVTETKLPEEYSTKEISNNSFIGKYKKL